MKEKDKIDILHTRPTWWMDVLQSLQGHSFDSHIFMPELKTSKNHVRFKSGNLFPSFK